VYIIGVKIMKFGYSLYFEAPELKKIKIKILGLKLLKL